MDHAINDGLKNCRSRGYWSYKIVNSNLVILFYLENRVSD